MVKSTGKLQHQILHIRSLSPSGASTSERIPIPEGVIVDACPDVYRAIARLSTQDDAPTRVVIVHVDDLAPIELEFFPLVKRLRPEVAVYVYSGLPDSPRIATAIDLGADAVATAELIGRDLDAAETSPTQPDAVDPMIARDRTIDADGAIETERAIAADLAILADQANAADRAIDAPPTHADSSDVAADLPGIRLNLHADDLEAELETDDDASAGIGTVDGDPLEDADHDDDIDTESEERESEDAGDLHAPVRVPWLRRDDAPIRRAPPRGKTTDDDPVKPGSREAGSRGPSSHDSGTREPTAREAGPREAIAREPSAAKPDRGEPLLTEAELRALIGDDEGYDDHEALGDDDDSNPESLAHP